MPSDFCGLLPEDSFCGFGMDLTFTTEDLYDWYSRECAADQCLDCLDPKCNCECGHDDEK